MSAPSAEPKRASAAAIFGIAAALMALALLAAFLIVRRAQAIDGRATLAEALEIESLPAGYEIGSAMRLANGSRLVTLRDPAAPPELAAATETGGADSKVDWTKVPLGDDATPPREVALLLVERDSAKSALEEAFKRDNLSQTANLPPSGGRVLIDEGRLPWRGYDARWTLVRNFEPGPTFRDVIRADVGLPDRPALLTAVWSRGKRGSKAALEKLLAALSNG